MTKIRFYCSGFTNPEQDYERHETPRQGDYVELPGPDGSPLPFIVRSVHWVMHNVIPADVVVFLERMDYEWAAPGHV
jgi:hypothetical protein